MAEINMNEHLLTSVYFIYLKEELPNLHFSVLIEYNGISTSIWWWNIFPPYYLFSPDEMSPATRCFIDLSINYIAESQTFWHSRLRLFHAAHIERNYLYSHHLFYWWDDTFTWTDSAHKRLFRGTDSHEYAPPPITTILTCLCLVITILFPTYSHQLSLLICNPLTRWLLSLVQGKNVTNVLIDWSNL